MDKQHAHQLLDQLEPGQFAAVVQLLEVMIDAAGNSGDEPLTEEDRRAVVASRDWFQENPAGIPFERVVADCGLTLEDVESCQSD